MGCFGRIQHRHCSLLAANNSCYQICAKENGTLSVSSELLARVHVARINAQLLPSLPDDFSLGILNTTHVTPQELIMRSWNHSTASGLWWHPTSLFNGHILIVLHRWINRKPLLGILGICTAKDADRVIGSAEQVWHEQSLLWTKHGQICQQRVVCGCA